MLEATNLFLKTTPKYLLRHLLNRQFKWGQNITCPLSSSTYVFTPMCTYEAPIAASLWFSPLSSYLHGV